jgi:methylated-DNA-[protein]-cysteine S-methyltransferase
MLPGMNGDVPGDRPTVAFGALRTPVGSLLVGCSEQGVCTVSFRRGAERQRSWRGYRVVAEPERTAASLAALGGYFGGDRSALADLDVDWRFATRVQRQVLGTLHATVGFGEVVTYGELAHRSGTGIPARAVGTVMGSNPVPLVVPCHRVVASTGLGGYSGGTGTDVKRWLLTLEGVLAPTLDWDPAASLPGLR